MGDSEIKVQLEVECGSTKMGDEVAVVGSLPTLGNWSLDTAVKLNGHGFPLWRGEVCLPSGVAVEYKYIILRRKGGVQWEGFDGNRQRHAGQASCIWKDGTFGQRPSLPEEAEISSHFPTNVPAATAAAGDLERQKAATVLGGSDPQDCKATFLARRADSKHEKQPSQNTSALLHHENRSSDPKSIVVGKDITVYGKVTLDYGTLEQRMAKRMDQPTELQGDHDQDLRSYARSRPKARLESDLATLERSALARVEVWPAEQRCPLPPSTCAVEDSSRELEEIVAFESRGAVTLAERFQAARSMLERAEAGSAIPWTVLVWLRFSQVRQLTWQRRSNTRPANLSTAAFALSELIAKRWVERPAERHLWRLLLACVPRGSSSDDGQAIRDYILTIMQKFQLKKRKGDFMEQWHQKLHNNTTPDDIYICEAYLRFLRSEGDLQEFYGHLEAHQITRERLQTFERPIIQEPVFYPSIKNALINEFEHYLEILKRVHAGADLEKCVDAASERLSEDTLAMLEAVIAEGGTQGFDRAMAALGGVAAARCAVAPTLQRTAGARDRLYLDLALEARARLLAEGLGSSLGLQAAGLATSLLFEGLCRSFGGLELTAALRDLVASLGSTGDSLRRAAAAAERARCAVAASVGDSFIALQPRAQVLGERLRAATPEALPEVWAVDIFAEEAARGGPGFAVSIALTVYERHLRSAIGGGAWQLVSMTEARMGQLHVLQAIHGNESLDAPSVVLVERLGGEEDPPEGTVAVITPDAVDVLSHIAVRARTMGVFLASCFDPEALEAIRSLSGRHVSIAAKAGAVLVQEACAGVVAAVPSEQEKLEAKSQPVPATKKSVCVAELRASTSNWVSEGSLAACSAAGAKSHNLADLRAKLPAWIKLPRSAVIPHGVLARVLAAPENDGLASRHRELTQQLAFVVDVAARAEHLLAQIREVVRNLRLPDSMAQEMQAAVEHHGGVAGDRCWWGALVAVWASSWGDRAYHACRRAGILPGRVAMSVLVQRLVEAEYSFVAHTRHPTGDPEELYAEVVVGLGEVLVGNYPGRALGFSAPRNGSGPPRIVTLPSKAVALSSTGLIFRSDSNTEDLEDFAGAGLFDSVPVSQTSERILEYRNERLLEDLAFQQQLLQGIAKLAMDVEGAAGGSAQDIEGCYVNGEFYVVQTRPQA